MTSFFDPFLRFVLLSALSISFAEMIFCVLEMVYVYRKNGMFSEARISPPLRDFSRQAAVVSANSEPGACGPGFMQ